MVKATLRSGGARSRSKTALRPSPARSAPIASEIRIHNDMRASYAASEPLNIGFTGV